MDIGFVLSQWQSVGVFDYVLPFLLVFAIVFGILETTKVLGKEKSIHLIVALVIGLLAIGTSMRMGYSLGDFLQEIFPRLGIGLAVLLSVLILVGLFVPDEQRRYWFYGLGAIAIIIALVVIVKSFDAFGFAGIGGYENYMGWIVGGILVIGIIIAVAVSGGGTSTPGSGAATRTPWTK